MASTYSTDDDVNVIQKPIEDILDAADELHTLRASMEIYHRMLCSWILYENKQLDIKTGLDALFDSIRIRGTKISKFLDNKT